MLQHLALGIRGILNATVDRLEGFAGRVSDRARRGAAAEENSNKSRENALHFDILVGMSDLTHARLRELLDYDPSTGYFVWLTPRGRNHAIVGKRAGTRNPVSGYIQIKVGVRAYSAHRLAWFYVHGSWPANCLDHVNGDRADNRIANLREATQAQNARNAQRKKTNSSGFKGVHWHAQAQKWRATILVNRRHISLGLFHRKEDAAKAYETAAHKHHGAFSRTR